MCSLWESTPYSIFMNANQKVAFSSPEASYHNVSSFSRYVSHGRFTDDTKHSFDFWKWEVSTMSLLALFAHRLLNLSVLWFMRSFCALRLTIFHSKDSAIQVFCFFNYKISHQGTSDSIIFIIRISFKRYRVNVRRIKRSNHMGDFDSSASNPNSFDFGWRGASINWTLSTDQWNSIPKNIWYVHFDRCIQTFLFIVTSFCSLSSAEKKSYVYWIKMLLPAFWTVSAVLVKGPAAELLHGALCATFSCKFIY